MRKFLIPLMLASVALPAAAIAGDEDRDARRAARAEQRADRPERADRAERGSPQPTQQQQPQPQAPQQQQQQQQPTQQEAPRQMRMERSGRGPDPQMQVERQQRQLEQQQQQQQQQRRGDNGQSPYVRPDREQRNWNGGAGQQPGVQPVDTVRDNRNRGPRVITTDGLPNGGGSVERQGRPAHISLGDRISRDQERELARRTRMPGLPPGATGGMFPHPRGSGGGLVSTPLPGGGELRHSSSGAQWATHWRNDRRYDWHDWRNRHRTSFHIGFYSDPFGFGYQRMGYGWQLWPSYYQSNYWLRDPWQYRLPPVYGPYRWVRYWDDAVLVDIYSGEVVDVIYDFFW